MLGGEISNILVFYPGFLAILLSDWPSGLNIVTSSLLVDARLFVDVALGLILFDLGRHLDFRWLKHDRGLLPMSMTESSLTFIAVFTVLYLFHFPWLSSALAATIAVATSPAVVMMVAHDLGATGPVTRRTLILTSLNNLFALLLFTILLPLTQLSTTHFETIIIYSTYRLLGPFF